MQIDELKKLSQLLRYDILRATSEAGSGHPTSSMSGVELAATLFFGGFLKYNPKDPHNPGNDRFVLSKGHASPLLYALYHVTGWISEKDLLSLRKFTSDYEGHPTPRIPWVDAATGSLGQGLSVGVGMALALRARISNFKFQISNFPRVYVLLGDSEMAEGQVWEAMEIASYYNLGNLVAIIDVNRLGQRGETMEGWDLDTYRRRAEAFGWRAIVVEDGHDISQVYRAFQQATGVEEGGLPTRAQTKSSTDGRITTRQASVANRPIIIIAKTKKGKGVSFLENKDDWHGKAVPKDKLEAALKELGEIDIKVRGVVDKPAMGGRGEGSRAAWSPTKLRRTPTGGNRGQDPSLQYKLSDLVATREAYGDALVALGSTDERIVAFDGEVSNSTFSDKFKKAYPDRFFEMFIAEQNMVSAALGASKVGLIPFASTFAAFLARAYDQIRMAQYSKPNLKLAGSHAGVSIGTDGPSQMALEDLAMMRAVLDAIVFYPSDAVSTAGLVEIMAQTDGLFYMRTTREKTPVLYKSSEKFTIGGSKVLHQSTKDTAVVFAAGITVHEALKAHEELQKEGINIAVVDLYSVKPIDNETVRQFSNSIKNVIVVEDHYPAGGLGEAVSSVILNKSSSSPTPIGDLDSRLRRNDIHFTHLAVRKTPRSGTPEELLRFAEIDSAAIVKAVKNF